jgi:hypothetical protein
MARPAGGNPGARTWLPSRSTGRRSS